MWFKWWFWFVLPHAALVFLRPRSLTSAGDNFKSSVGSSDRLWQGWHKPIAPEVSGWKRFLSTGWWCVFPLEKSESQFLNITVKGWKHRKMLAKPTRKFRMLGFVKVEVNCEKWNGSATWNRNCLLFMTASPSEGLSVNRDISEANTISTTHIQQPTATTNSQ